MELGRILDSQKAVAEERRPGANGSQAVGDTCGDYILPAPLALLQKELLDTVISAHYSELLGFLDTDTLTHKYSKDLAKMLGEIQQITTHPWLLLTDLLPANLTTKDSPFRIGEISGKFEVLGKIVRTTRDLGLHIAVLVGDTLLADLVEAYLADKTPSLFRYSAGKTINHPPPQPGFQTSVTCVHIVPSRLEDLIASVNYAFDFMIVLDDTFDTASAYAQGIRAQLRDPSKRVPLAPLVRLVPLSSVNHVMPYTAPGPLDRETLTAVLGSTVVLNQDAGNIPPEMHYLYDNDLRDMLPWFQNPDRPWPLVRPPLPLLFRPNDVEQVILAHEKTSDPDSKRIKLSEAEPEEPAALTVNLLRRIQQLADKNGQLVAEAESLRGGASRRQQTLEAVQSEMAGLVEENARLKRRREDDERKVAKYRADAERLEELLRTQREELEAARAAPPDTAAARLTAATAETVQLREEVQRLTTRAEQQTKDIDYMRQQYQTASSAANEAELERQRLEGQVAALREASSEAALRMRQATVAAEASEQRDQLASLQAELSNCRETLRILSETSSSVSGRDRSRINRSQAPRSRSGTPLS